MSVTILHNDNTVLLTEECTKIVVQKDVSNIEINVVDGTSIDVLEDNNTIEIVDTLKEIIEVSNSPKALADPRLDTHLADLSNPHQVTKAQVGLGNVDNTSDLNKPISTATQTALDAKADITYVDTQDASTLSSANTYTDNAVNPHIADSTIHFTEASINHANIQNIGTNTHTQIDSHIADTTKHFTEASISHLNIQDIGVNSHIAIDSHLANTSNPHSVTASQAGAVAKTGDTMTGALQVNANFTSGVMYWDYTTGRLAVGFNQNDITVGGTTYGAKISVHTEGGTDLAEYVLGRHTDTAGFGAHMMFYRTRGTEATETAVQDGDSIARIMGGGHDGTDLERCAEIEYCVDGTVSSGIVPSCVKIKTTNTSGALTQALNIDNTQNIKAVATTGTFVTSNMTTIQRDALTPLNGMTIYNTTTNQTEHYSNGSWEVVAELLDTNVDEDSSNSNYIYVGDATAGSATSSAVWRIKRLDFTSGLVTTYADGNTNFDNVYDNRESLIYS